MRHRPPLTKKALAPQFLHPIRRAADRQEHKQNKRRFIDFWQTFTIILYSPARTEWESLFSPLSTIRVMAVPGLDPGIVPAIHDSTETSLVLTRSPNRKAFALCSRQGVGALNHVDGRDKPGHDAVAHPPRATADNHAIRPQQAAGDARNGRDRHWPPTST
jgi:hypothetical protein